MYILIFQNLFISSVSHSENHSFALSFDAHTLEEKADATLRDMQNSSHPRADEGLVCAFSKMTFW